MSHIGNCEHVPCTCGNYATQPPIRAWRLFMIQTPFTRDNGEPYLISPVQGGTILYPNQVYKAKCLHHEHDAPEFHCTCGWYAFKKRRDCRMYIKTAIMGEVLLGGKIIETELGYRAEQMVITKIYWNKGVRHEVTYL